jgi:hypothetical protein
MPQDFTLGLLCFIRLKFFGRGVRVAASLSTSAQVNFNEPVIPFVLEKKEGLVFTVTGGELMHINSIKTGMQQFSTRFDSKLSQG